jgi:hypothetical protein
MTLSYLDFDYSEDTDGHGSFDAMASAAPSRLAVLMQEVVCVLAWAHREFGPPASQDDSSQWDYELQGAQEVATALEVHYDAQHETLAMQPAASVSEPRTTLSLTLSGSSAFSEAFRRAFVPAE